MPHPTVESPRGRETVLPPLHVVPAVTDTRLAEVAMALKEAIKSRKEKKDT